MLYPPSSSDVCYPLCYPISPGISSRTRMISHLKSFALLHLRAAHSAALAALEEADVQLMSQVSSVLSGG